jgi:hypothetical protein
LDNLGREEGNKRRKIEKNGHRLSTDDGKEDTKKVKKQEGRRKQKREGSVKKILCSVITNLTLKKFR